MSLFNLIKLDKEISDLGFSNILKGVSAYIQQFWKDTVDGRIPAPVDVVKGKYLIIYKGFIHPRWLFGISEPINS